MQKKFAVILCVWLSNVIAFAQQVIFNDNFSADPAANGWTENVVGTNTATGSIVGAGTSAQVGKDTGPSNGAVTATTTRTIDTTGFQNVEIELVAFQSNTTFEGGAYLASNVDSLSFYYNIGAGFVPLFQRTGVWAAGGTGFSTGGTAAGNLVPTSTGFLLLDPGAANNPNLQIQIEVFVSAAAEDYFLDDFTIRGTRIPLVLSATVLPGSRKEDPMVLIRDENAIQSLVSSGLPVVSSLKEVNLSAVRSAGRDINERLFRLRSGLGIGEFGQRSDDLQSVTTNLGVNSIVGGMAPMPKEIVVSPEVERSEWELFVSGDFGLTDQDPVADLAAFEGETYSSSVGVEWAGGETWALGFAWTYLESDNDFFGNLGSADITGNSASAYATWVPSDTCYVSLRYGYIDLENDIHRNTGLGSTMVGTPNALAHKVDLDGGYHFRLGERDRQLVTGPIFGLDYTNGEIDGYSERGPSRGALNVSGQDYESLVSRLGWQISKRMRIGKMSVTPQVRAAWEHENQTAEDEIDVSLQKSPFLLVRNGQALKTGGSFGAVATQGNTGRDYLSAGSGVRVVFDDALSLSLDYEGHFQGDGRTSHFGGVRFSVSY